MAFRYNTARTRSLTTGSFKKPMTDLLAIIQNGNGNIKLEINDEDMAAMQTLAYDSLRKTPEKVEDSSYNSVLYNTKDQLNS